MRIRQYSRLLTVDHCRLYFTFESGSIHAYGIFKHTPIDNTKDVSRRCVPPSGDFGHEYSLRYPE